MDDPLSQCDMRIMTHGGRPKTAIVSGVRIVRDILAWHLEREASVEVVEVASGLQNVVRARDLDAVLLDATTSAPIALRSPLALALAPQRIAVFALPEEDGGMAWVTAGVRVCLTVTATVTELVEAVHAVMRGDILCSKAAIAALAVSAMADGGGPGATKRPGTLTAREREVLSLIAQRRSNKQIAYSLGVTLSTVKNHVHSILSKLRVSTRDEAITAVLDVVID